jgi:DNA repair protein RadC
VLGQRLLQRFDNPAAIFKASFQDLMAVKGITPGLSYQGRGLPGKGENSAKMPG